MVPRKVGADWEVAAPAKLNLYLEVLGKRTDGFHELETLMVPVRIYDQIFWSSQATQSPRSSDSCTLEVDWQCRATPTANFASDDNLVLKAARRLADRAGIEPHGHFRLVKRIPTEAGMGGGSSDAAATLLLANECWQAGLSHDEIVELASELGSDVPFFINQGAAICRGRGEHVEPVGALPRLHFVIVKPAFGLSTPQVFAELGERHAPSRERFTSSARCIEKLIAELRCGAIGKACTWMTNSLEAAAARIAPEILRIKHIIAETGCWGQFMTGSGSTVVGISRSATQARRAARQLASQNIGTVLAVASGW